MLDLVGNKKKCWFSPVKAQIHFNIVFQSDLNIVASYDRKGKYIFTGNAKGRVGTCNCLYSNIQIYHGKLWHLNINGMMLVLGPSFSDYAE